MFATLDLPLRDDNRHKRLKVGRACHPCRMKKIKCDGKLACMQCKARRRRCVYLKNTDTTYIKLGTDESLMEQDDDNATTTTTTTITPPPLREEKSHPTDYNQYADILFDMNKNKMSTETLYNISNINNGNNTLLSTSPGSTTGIVKNRSDKLMEELTQGLVQITLQQKLTKIKQSTFTPWQNYGDFVRWTSEPPLPDQYYGSIDMPPRLLQEHLIQIFFNQCHSFLPTMSKGMFYDQLNTRGPLITPLLLNMIYAHAATSPYGIHILKQYQQSIPSSALLESDTFYRRARHLLDDFLDVPRISTVIALLYMVAYEDNRYDMVKSNSYNNSNNNNINQQQQQQQQQRIRSSRAWTYSGMAIRMCLELGLHTSHYSSQMSQFDIELRKRVLWTCYVVDKIESCTMERPWMIKFQDISLDLPTSLPEDDQHERIALDGFAQLCRLMIIVEEVLNFFTYEMDSKKNNNNSNNNSNNSSSSKSSSNTNNSNSNSSCNHNNEWSSKEESYILQFLEKVYQWRARLPNELGWDPQSDQIPFSATIANLHLISYNLELSLILCCQHQLDQLQHKRRHFAATAITHLVFIMSQHPHLVYTSSISGFSGVFAALSHAIDIDHPLMEVSENAKQQFILSLESIRKLVDKINSQDIKRFIELIDSFLKPTKKLSSSSSSSTTSSTTSSSSFSRTPPPSQNNNNNNNNSNSNNNDINNNNINNNNNNDTNSNSKISNRDLLIQHMLGTSNLFDPQMIAKTLKTLQYQQQQQQQHTHSLPTPFSTPSPSPMEAPVSSSSTNHNTNTITATATATATAFNHNNIISTTPSSVPLLTTSYEPSSQSRPSISSSTCTTPSPSIHSRINPFCLQTPEVLAAATAIGAVGTPLINPHQIPILTTSSTTASMMPSSITIPNGPLKNIEPADYTFELISVDDEWAKSLIY